jgi:hypothetical protein
MSERTTTTEEVRKKATDTEATLVRGGGKVVAASEGLHQRTVATSLTQGTVTLRYAPRTTKAGDPVDTAF